LDSATRRHHPPERRQAAGRRPDWENEPRPTLLQRLLSIVRTALPRGAVILVVVTGIYTIAGVIKAKVIGHYFGQGPETDALVAAFTISSLLLNVLLVGGLLACFVPIYTGLRDEDPAEARAFGRTVLTLGTLVITLAIGVLFVFAPQAISIFAPGFQGEELDMGVNLIRLLCVSQVIFAASWVLGEVLLAEQRWVWYGIAGALYLGGIIAGTLLLGGTIGIYSAGVGAIAGALIHLGVRLFGVFRTPFRPWPSLNLRVKGLREYVWLSLPKMVSHPIDQLVLLYFGRLASELEPGSVARVGNALDFRDPLVLLIGTQFALAAFPALSQAADEGDRRRFRKIFSTNLATIAVLSTGAAMCALFLGQFAISIVLGGGAFTRSDVEQTALVLAVFSVSIPLEAVTELLARSIYATRNTILPTTAQVAGFVAIVATAQYLLPTAGILAIPAAYTMGMLTKAIILAIVLRPRMDAIGRAAPEQAAYAQAYAATGYSGRAGSGRQPWAVSSEPRMGRERPPRRRRTAVPQLAGIVAVVVVLLGGAAAAVWASQGASFGFTPDTTPWARVRPSQIAATTPEPTASMTFVAPSATPTVGPVATPAGPTPEPTPTGQFAMDLFHEGDYVGELTNKWCIPAAMQTMMNIMDEGADTTEETQNKLFDLGVSIARSRQGVPEPESWAQGLTQLGYGNFKVATTTGRQGAIELVAKQIRITNRPAGLLVWYGWHAWVVSGFVATADPAETDDFLVEALFIEDVWYPRHSSLWNKDRDGYSRPPDSQVPAGILHEDFKAWDQAVNYPDYQDKFVVIIPVP
jgi:putative peptidoglycan lipid II flippase